MRYVSERFKELSDLPGKHANVRVSMGDFKNDSMGFVFGPESVQEVSFKQVYGDNGSLSFGSAESCEVTIKMLTSEIPQNIKDLDIVVEYGLVDDSETLADGTNPTEWCRMAVVRTSNELIEDNGLFSTITAYDEFYWNGTFKTLKDVCESGIYKLKDGAPVEFTPRELAHKVESLYGVERYYSIIANAPQIPIYSYVPYGTLRDYASGLSTLYGGSASMALGALQIKSKFLSEHEAIGPDKYTAGNATFKPNDSQKEPKASSKNMLKRSYSVCYDPDAKFATEYGPDSTNKGVNYSTSMAPVCGDYPYTGSTGKCWSVNGTVFHRMSGHYGVRIKLDDVEPGKTYIISFEATRGTNSTQGLKAVVESVQKSLTAVKTEIFDGVNSEWQRFFVKFTAPEDGFIDPRFGDDERYMITYPLEFILCRVNHDGSGKRTDDWIFAARKFMLEESSADAPSPWEPAIEEMCNVNDNLSSSSIESLCIDEMEVGYNISSSNGDYESGDSVSYEPEPYSVNSAIPTDASSNMLTTITSTDVNGTYRGVGYSKEPDSVYFYGSLELSAKTARFQVVHENSPVSIAPGTYIFYQTVNTRWLPSVNAYFALNGVVKEMTDKPYRFSVSEEGSTYYWGFRVIATGRELGDFARAHLVKIDDDEPMLDTSGMTCSISNSALGSTTFDSTKNYITNPDDSVTCEMQPGSAAALDLAIADTARVSNWLNAIGVLPFRADPFSVTVYGKPYLEGFDRLTLEDIQGRSGTFTILFEQHVYNGAIVSTLSAAAVSTDTGLVSGVGSSDIPSEGGTVRPGRQLTWDTLGGKPFDSVDSETLSTTDGVLSVKPYSTSTSSATAAAGWTLSTNQLVRRNGFVDLKINCNRTSSSVTLNSTAVDVATIPSGYRPYHSYIITVSGTDGRHALVEILTDGTLRISRCTYPGQSAWSSATTTTNFWISATYAV